MGAGHVQRCLTLAKSLHRRGIECIFASRNLPGNRTDEINRAGFQVLLLGGPVSANPDNPFEINQEADAQMVLDALAGTTVEWVVVDHYGLDNNWEIKLAKELGNPQLLVIDDLADRKHASDILLDMAPARRTADYENLVPAEAIMLLGLEFALLRAEFGVLRARSGKPGNRCGSPVEILATFGGGDNAEAVAMAVEAFEQFQMSVQASLTLVGKLGKDHAKNCNLPNITFVEHEPDMASRMRQSDMIISAAGGTSWERCSLGIPGVVLCLAENQRENFAAIDEAGAGLCVNNNTGEILTAMKRLQNEPELYADIACRAWELCDAKGVDRVVSVMLANTVRLIAATDEDTRFVYEARYAGEAQHYYKNPVKPEFESHRAWFSSALVNPDYGLYCAVLGDDRIGHVRFDYENRDRRRAEVGIALAPIARGKGLSHAVLQVAVDFARDGGVEIFDAEVHEDNKVSRLVFEQAGFALVERLPGQFLHYQLGSL